MIAYQILVKADGKDTAVRELKRRVGNAVNIKVYGSNHGLAPRGQYKLLFSNCGERISEWGVTATDRILVCWFRETLESNGPRLMEFSDA